MLEILRAKYSVVISQEMQIRNIVGNLPSGYNRDFQLLKEPVFKSFEIVLESLQVLSEVFKICG